MSAPKALRVCHCRECGNYCEDDKNNCDALSRAMSPKICWAKMSEEKRMAVDKEIIKRVKESGSNVFHYRKKCEKEERGKR